MLVVITYDVNTETPAGRKRLRQISRQCVNYGQRVQNSVFECLLDPAQCQLLQDKLIRIMNPETDSLRFYYLGSRYEKKIQHFGRKPGYYPEDILII
jgi:CRISPR-associated protein Cas2